MTLPASVASRVAAARSRARNTYWCGVNARQPFERAQKVIRAETALARERTEAQISIQPVINGAHGPRHACLGVQRQSAIVPR